MLSCPRCDQPLRVPVDRGVLRLKCPLCRVKWDWDPSSPTRIALDYYELLQVSPNADLDVIDAAYRRLARKHHPDTSNDPLAGRTMALLNEAASVLTDVGKRGAYDATRAGSDVRRQRPGSQTPRPSDSSSSATTSGVNRQPKDSDVDELGAHTRQPEVTIEASTTPDSRRRISSSSGWIVVWCVLSALSVLGAVMDREWEKAISAPVGVAFLLLICATVHYICAAVHYSKSPCPGCGRRWTTTTWDHQRGDGGPDRRFKSNNLRCSSCGIVRA